MTTTTNDRGSGSVLRETLTAHTPEHDRDGFIDGCSCMGSEFVFDESLWVAHVVDAYREALAARVEVVDGPQRSPFAEIATRDLVGEVRRRLVDDHAAGAVELLDAMTAVVDGVGIGDHYDESRWDLLDRRAKETPHARD